MSQQATCSPFLLSVTAQSGCKREVLLSFPPRHCSALGSAPTELSTQKGDQLQHPQHKTHHPASVPWDCNPCLQSSGAPLQDVTTWQRLWTQKSWEKSPHGNKKKEKSIAPPLMVFAESQQTNIYPSLSHARRSHTNTVHPSLQLLPSCRHSVLSGSHF